MTPGANQTPCGKVFETYKIYLRDLYDAIDELENALYDSSKDELDGGVSMVDSALEDLEDQTREYQRVKSLCNGCLGCLESLAVSLQAIESARKASQLTVAEVEEILEKTPSDGEKAEEQLEDLRSVAEEFASEIRSFFK